MTISTMAQTHDTRLQKTLLFPSQQGWKSKTFLKPDSHIRLATVFSGIGAVEQAFHRLNLNHTIVFSGDIYPYVKKVILETIN